MYRIAALAAGCFYAIFGVLGLIPPLHENWPSDEPLMTVRNGRGFLFGLFPNNLPLSLLYLCLGVWGLFAFRSTRTAVLHVRSLLVLFTVLAVCGLLPDVHSLAGVIPTFGNTTRLHVATAVLAAGFVAASWRVPDKYPTLPAPDTGAGVVSVASVAGVPVHAFLASFPLAFLLGALATDLAHWWTTLDWYVDYDGFWGTASVWLIGAGLAGAVLASVVGLVDVWTTRETRRRKLLSTHVLGSVGVMLLAALNLGLRFPDHDAAVIPWGIVLSLLSAALLSYSGWYAGHVLHREVIRSACDSAPAAPEVQPPAESVSIASDSSSRPPEIGRQGRGTSSWD